MSDPHRRRGISRVATSSKAITTGLAGLWLIDLGGVFHHGSLGLAGALVTSTLVIVTVAWAVTFYVLAATERRAASSDIQLQAYLTVQRQRTVDEVAYRIAASQQTVLMPLLERAAAAKPAAQSTTYVSRPNTVDQSLRDMLDGAMAERTGDIPRPATGS